MLNFKKTFFANIITLGSYNYSSELANFLSSIVLARLLLPEEYGIVAMAAVFTNFAMIFTGAGIGSDIIRSDYGMTYHKAMANLSLHMSIVLFTLMCILAYPIALFYDNMKLVFPVIVLSSQFLFRGMSMAHYAVLMKKLRFKYMGKVTFFTTLTSITLMITLALLNFSYWSLIIPLVIVEFIKYIYFSKATNIKFKIYPFVYTVAAYRKAKTIIWNILGVSVINYWSRNIDKLLIGKTYGESSLGIFNRGARFLDLSLKLIARLFGTVLYPSLKKLEDEQGDVRKEYINILGVISLLNFPIAAILILIPEIFVLFLWGENWTEVAKFLPYFGLLTITQSLIHTNDVMFKLLRQEHKLFIITMISASLMILAIIAGSTISVLKVAQFLALAYLSIIIPFQLIFGFIKALNYKVKTILWFWGPKLILTNAALYTIWANHTIWTIIIMAVYCLHLIYYQRKDISKFFIIAREKLKEKFHSKRTSQ
ncbi:MAG: oligosaccharide flippase family protein [Bacteroidales bacterium]